MRCVPAWMLSVIATSGDLAERPCCSAQRVRSLCHVSPCDDKTHDASGSLLTTGVFDCAGSPSCTCCRTCRLACRIAWMSWCPTTLRCERGQRLRSWQGCGIPEVIKQPLVLARPAVCADAMFWLLPRRVLTSSLTAAMPAIEQLSVSVSIPPGITAPYMLCMAPLLRT